MAVSPGEGSPFKARFSTVLKFVLFLGLGVLVIWISLRNLTESEKTQILIAFKTANYNWVILAVLLGIMSHVLRSLRWMLFFEPMGYKPSLKNTFYAVMIGYFANLAFPRLGEVSRCGILAKYEKIPFNKGFGTVITERAIDMLIFFLLFLLTIFTQMGTIDSYLATKIYPRILEKFQNPDALRNMLYGVIFLVVLIFAVIIVFRKRLARSKGVQKLKGIILGFWEGLKSLSQIKRPVLFVFYSLMIWVLYFFMLYVCFFCFPATGSLSLGAGLSALVLGSVGIMITPGGIGLYPAIISETLRLYGISLTTGLALGWIAWSAQTGMIIVVGALSLLLLSFNKKPHGQD
jgi:glycosyltransferase 2 family protein